MLNKKQLSVLLANNWYLHDQKGYEKIRTNSINLLTSLGYTLVEAKYASERIKKLYVLSDERYIINSKMFNKMVSLCDEMDIYLHQARNSKNEINWWKAFRDKNYFIGAIYLFIDQLSKLGLLNLIPATFAAKKLFNAGIAHNKKDWNLVRKYTLDYWNIINSVSHKKFIEF